MKLKAIKSILIFIAILFIFSSISYAAGNISLSSSKSTIDKGESVTLYIKGNNAYGKVVVTATNATVNTSSVFLQNDTQQVTVTSNSTEDINITVSPDPTHGLGDGDENPITESKRLTIKVNKPQTGNSAGTTTPTTPSTPSTPTTPSTPNTPTVTEKSSNANVKMIETSPVDFTGFKANKTSGYEVAVENDVDRITVNVTKEDSKASVSLLNRTNSDTGKSWVYIAEGNNEIDVTVTSEDGKNKKTYTINVNRKAKEVVEEEPTKPEEQKPEEQEPEVEEPTTEEPKEEIFGLSELTIEGVELKPKFRTYVYEYKVDLKEDLAKLNITTVATDAKATVEITGNENLQEGENVITIIVKGEVEAETVAYQIIVNKTIPALEDTMNLETDHQNMIRKKVIIPVIAGIILSIIIIAIIVNKSKKNNKRYIPYENVMDDYEDDTLEEQNKPHSRGKRFK